MITVGHFLETESERGFSLERKRERVSLGEVRETVNSEVREGEGEGLGIIRSGAKVGATVG